MSLSSSSSSSSPSSSSGRSSSSDEDEEFMHSFFGKRKGAAAAKKVDTFDLEESQQKQQAVLLAHFARKRKRRPEREGQRDEMDEKESLAEFGPLGAIDGGAATSRRRRYNYFGVAEDESETGLSLRDEDPVEVVDNPLTTSESIVVGVSATEPLAPAPAEDEAVEILLDPVMESLHANASVKPLITQGGVLKSMVSPRLMRRMVGPRRSRVASLSLKAGAINVDPASGRVVQTPQCTISSSMPSAALSSSASSFGRTGSGLLRFASDEDDDEEETYQDTSDDDTEEIPSDKEAQHEVLHHIQGETKGKSRSKSKRKSKHSTVYDDSLTQQQPQQQSQNAYGTFLEDNESNGPLENSLAERSRKILTEPFEKLSRHTQEQVQQARIKRKKRVKFAPREMEAMGLPAGKSIPNLLVVPDQSSSSSGSDTEGGEAYKRYVLPVTQKPPMLREEEEEQEQEQAQQTTGTMKSRSRRRKRDKKTRSENRSSQRGVGTDRRNRSGSGGSSNNSSKKSRRQSSSEQRLLSDGMRGGGASGYAEGEAGKKVNKRMKSFVFEQEQSSDRRAFDSESEVEQLGVVRWCCLIFLPCFLFGRGLTSAEWKQEMKKSLMSLVAAISLTQLIVMIVALARGGIKDTQNNPALGPPQDILIRFGAESPNLIKADAELWRLFTSLFLHAGILHVILNFVVQLRLGLYLERRWKWTRFAVIYCITGFAGNLLACLLEPLQVSANASTGLIGVIGAYLCETIFTWYKTESHQRIISLLSCVVYILLTFILGSVDIFIDNSANFGGILIGVLIGCYYSLKESQFDNAIKDIVPKVILVVVTVYFVVCVVIFFTLIETAIENNPSSSAPHFTPPSNTTSKSLRFSLSSYQHHLYHQHHPLP